MTHKKHSMVMRVFCLLMMVIFAQGMLSFNTILYTNIATTVENSNYTLFTRTVNNRKSSLESFISTGWSNIADQSAALSQEYQNFSKEGESLSEEDKVAFLTNSVDTLLSMFMTTGSTGCFVILDDGEDMKYNYSALYLKRDNQIDQAITNETIQMVRGPSETSKTYNFYLDSNWSYGLAMTEEHYPILSKPLEALSLTKNFEYLGYWHISADLSSTNKLILTYSMPILDENGNGIGVVGVEISQEHLYRFLPEQEFGDTGYQTYFLASVSADDTMIPTMLDNEQIFSLGESLTLSALPDSTAVLEDRPQLLLYEEQTLCVYGQALNLYVNNSPFADEEIYLIGAADHSNMTSFTREFWSVIARMLVISMLAGLFISYFMGLLVAKPIVKLSKQVANYDVKEKLSFKDSGIQEIDDLSSTIASMQEKILRSANRTDKILELLNIGVGSFEYVKGEAFVTVSQGMYKILDISAFPTGEIPQEVFFQRLDDLKSKPIEDVEKTYAYGDNNQQYFKVDEFHQEGVILGVIQDCSKEVEDLIVLNYERNYDVLTGIYNRRAFHQKVEDVLRQGELAVAGFVMFDLDNLKYVNDTFGHDSGDVYIKTAATTIYSSLCDSAVVGRMSGDEFYAFLYGFSSQEELMASLTALYRRFELEPIAMPNATDFQIRVSGGIAWYGLDSCDLEELKKYADFAMYKGKHTVKGEMRQFNLQQYLEESFMLSGKEELNYILDQEKINFVFQPIIHVKTGEIYSYEALMRPISDTLSTPIKLLQLAALEGKSWKVEKLAFYKTLELYQKYSDMFQGAKLFINSIPNEHLKEEEYLELQEKYQDVLPYIVVEITEQEQQDYSVVDDKLSKLRTLNMDIALDDYGSGYANDMGLIKMMPDIVKIDRSLISNVHVDPSRQTIVHKIIALCKEHNITVLGEGIETEQELDYLIQAGIELAQGFYISRPMELPNFNTADIRQKLGTN